jgi:hypothetical protein
MSSAAPPIRTGGIIRRNGRRTGSVTLFTNLMIGKSQSGGRVKATTQDKITVASRNQKKTVRMSYRISRTNETARMTGAP